jgi:demethylmenaquinone methyltransferase/2-methoxy-6-polyprenyl-1,4-benzoquinol methylase
MTKSEAGSADGSGAMFDRIAHRYDSLNRLMSLGLDRGWRRELVRRLMVDHGEVLDVATGTADVALAVARAYPNVRVVGVDPSAEMLAIGEEKALAAGLAHRIALEVGDAQALPFESERFAACCISFGIRNVPDRARALAEMARVTRRGGRVVVLELSEPGEGVLGRLARIHVRHVVPRLGAWISGADEYRYLQRSIAAFPPPARFATSMSDAGLDVEAVVPLAFGSAQLFVGRRRW